MKTTLLILTLLSSTFFTACDFGRNADRISISIKNTAKSYSFKANYPEQKTKKVIAYMKETLKVDTLFYNETTVKDSEVRIADGTKFYLKAEPGFLNIDFNKQQNSSDNYRKIEKLCLVLKELMSN